MAPELEMTIDLPQRPARHHRSCFTLIELLVVVSILSVLMAMLLPSLARARTTVKVTSCVSNHRQIGLGLQSYAGDSDGWFPPSPTTSSLNSPSMYWNQARNIDLVTLLEPHIGDFRLFVCPVNPRAAARCHCRSVM